MDTVPADLKSQAFMKVLFCDLHPCILEVHGELLSMGIKPRVSCMLNRDSSVELDPQPVHFF